MDGRSMAGLGSMAAWKMLSGLGVAALLVLVVAVLWARLVAAQRAYKRERRCREEMEAYVRLDTRLAQGSDVQRLAWRVCEVVAGRSPFHRVAVLLRAADGRLYLTATSGLEVVEKGVVERWLAQVEERERNGKAAIGGRVSVGAKSHVVWLDEDHRAVVVPIWVTGGSMAGVLVVFASSILQVRRQAAEEAVVSLEALGMKLRQAMDDAELTEKLLAAEKLMITEVAWVAAQGYPQE